MTLAIKIPKKNAQQMQQYLLITNKLNKAFKLQKDDDFVYFPVHEKFDSEYDFVNYELDQKEESPGTFKEELAKVLTESELERVKTAYDTVGDIAILEIDDFLAHKKLMIANVLLKINPKIHTVLRKSGEHATEYRTQTMEFLAGEDKRGSVVKENGVKLEIDVENVYYSIRLATERKRIMEQIQKNEEILCMFSGAGPYPIVFAKNTLAKHITAIEINPVGHALAIKNAQQNNINNITFYCGDVNVIIPKKIVPQTFDRITMPLPKTADEFLPTALQCARSGTIIHYYAFLHEDEFATAHEDIKQACESAKLQYHIIDTIKCGQHAPRIWRICVDLKIR